MIAGTVQNHFTPQSFRLHWLVPTYCQAAWIPWIGIINRQFSFCFRHEDLQPPKFNLNESQRDLFKFSSGRIGSWKSVMHRSRTNLAKRCWVCRQLALCCHAELPLSWKKDLQSGKMRQTRFSILSQLVAKPSSRTHLIPQRPAWWHVQRTDTQ